MRFVGILLALGLMAGCGQPATVESEPESAPDAIMVDQTEATPVALIHALYAEPTIPYEPDAVRRYFTDEFVPGLTPSDEPGPANFDFR